MCVQCTYAHTQTNVRTHIYTHARTHAHTHTHTYTRRHTRTLTHTQNCCVLVPAVRLRCVRLSLSQRAGTVYTSTVYTHTHTSPENTHTHLQQLRDAVPPPGGLTPGAQLCIVKGSPAHFPPHTYTFTFHRNTRTETHTHRYTHARTHTVKLHSHTDKHMRAHARAHTHTHTHTPSNGTCAKTQCHYLPCTHIQAYARTHNTEGCHLAQAANPVSG